MNIFLPYKSFEKCAQSLDDRRLSKQILECHQILTMILKKKSDDAYKSPYLNHPVVKHYFNQEHHIVEYSLAMCKEFNYRFGRHHKYYISFIDKMTPKTNDFIPLYAEGSKNSQMCIREMSEYSVYALFKLKLMQKWRKDILNGHQPKWTNRKRPNFEGEN